jgi:23S rRNA (pseudouridine1915-N3)-methyltransferase
MLEVEVISFGGVRENFIKEGEKEYLKRICTRLKVLITEVDKDTDPVTLIENRFSKPSNAVILLDQRGSLLTSLELKSYFVAKQEKNLKRVSLLIGNSNGFPSEVIEMVKQHSRGDLLSLGRITFPHQFVRLILAEQLYRIESIMLGSSYHK